MMLDNYQAKVRRDWGFKIENFIFQKIMPPKRQPNPAKVLAGLTKTIKFCR
jgi:hypothetical protein